MSEVEKKPDAPVVEQPAKPETPPAPKAEKPEEKKEQTIAEVLDEGKKPEEKPNHIPEAAFLEEKKGRKAAEARVKELEDLVREGGSKGEVTAAIEDIAKRHNVDPGFLRELTASIRAEVRGDAGSVVDEKLKPLSERDKAERIGKAFDQHFAVAMEKVPEFKDIVNKEVIKTLALDPKNASKTISQIIEETYGNAIPGKRSIEQSKPGGSKEPGDVDFARARKDSTYFKEIMANPELKKKYNAGIENRIGF